MKRKIAVVLFVVSVSIVFSSACRAEDGKSAAASVGVMSNYVWRGLRLSDGWVVQPSVGVTYGGFGAGLWSNYDGDTRENVETDLTLGYSRAFDKVSLGAGYIYYALEGLEDTQEIYASLRYDFVVSPSLTYYYDYDVGTGSFIVFALDYSLALGDNASFSLGASASYLADDNVVGLDKNGEEYSGFHNGQLSVSLSFAVSENISVEPMAAYTFPLGDDAEDAIEALSFGGDATTFYGGLTVEVAF